MASVRVTEESALRTNTLENKCKREVAAAVQGIDKVDQEQTTAMATRIVADLIANDQGGYEKANKEQTE